MAAVGSSSLTLGHCSSDLFDPQFIAEHVDHIPVIGYCRTHNTCEVLLVQFVGSISNSMLWISLAFVAGIGVMFVIFRSWARHTTDITLLKAAGMAVKNVEKSV